MLDSEVAAGAGPACCVRLGLAAGPAEASPAREAAVHHRAAATHPAADLPSSSSNGSAASSSDGGSNGGSNGGSRCRKGCSLSAGGPTATADAQAGLPAAAPFVDAAHGASTQAQGALPLALPRHARMPPAAQGARACWLSLRPPRSSSVWTTLDAAQALEAAQAAGSVQAVRYHPSVLALLMPDDEAAAQAAAGPLAALAALASVLAADEQVCSEERWAVCSQGRCGRGEGGWCLCAMCTHACWLLAVAPVVSLWSPLPCQSAPPPPLSQDASMPPPKPCAPDEEALVCLVRQGGLAKEGLLPGVLRAAAEEGARGASGLACANEVACQTRCRSAHAALWLQRPGLPGAAGLVLGAAATMWFEEAAAGRLLLVAHAPLRGEATVALLLRGRGHAIRRWQQRIGPSGASANGQAGGWGALPGDC